MRAIKFFILSSAICAVFDLASGCTAKEAAVEEPISKINETRLRISADAVSNIKLVKVEDSEIDETLSLMGKVSPTEDRTTVVPSRVAGRIESVLVASGETVSKGQVLATLFSADFTAAAEEYLQSSKQKDAADGTSDFQIFSKLARKKLISMGLSTEDINRLSESSNSTPNLTVRAPRSGALVTKSAIVGNMANVGDTLFTIADLSQLWFVGDLYPEDLPRVKKDQEIIITGLAGTPPIYGKVSFISPMVDPTVRSIKLRALMQNPKLALRADMYVQGSLVLNKIKMLVIPVGAVLRNQDKNYVFKKVAGPAEQGANGTMILEKVSVEVGSESQGKIGVKSGLSANDEIVAEGAILLDSALTSAGK